MRIRTIKPEFWRSEDIKRLPFEDRLLFIGLWSYVDDNGVGIDDPRLIAADLFALEDDPQAIREYVREGLARLSRGLQIVRYEAGGKRLLFITNWDKHQKIDRPSKPRYPRPETIPTRQNDDEPGSFDEPSRGSRDSLDAGTGEQRNRGTEESPTALDHVTTDRTRTRTRTRDRAAALSATAHSPVAHRLITDYANTCRRRPPSTVLRELAVQVDALLAENWSPAELAPALEAWGAKGLHPKALPSVAHAIANAAPARARPPAVNATDAFAARFLAGGNPPASHTPPPLRALPGGA